MFTCQVTHTDQLIAALQRLPELAPASASYALAGHFRVLSIGDSAVLVDSDCESGTVFSILNPADFLAQVKTAGSPLALHSTNGTLCVGAPGAPTVATPEPLRIERLNPALVQLSATAKRAMLYANGAPVVVRNGQYGLSFVVGLRSEVMLELLPRESFFTFYRQGDAVSRQALPPLSAHEFLRALYFPLLKLE